MLLLRNKFHLNNMLIQSMLVSSQGKKETVNWEELLTKSQEDVSWKKMDSKKATQDGNHLIRISMIKELLMRLDLNSLEAMVEPQCLFLTKQLEKNGAQRIERLTLSQMKEQKQ